MLILFPLIPRLSGRFGKRKVVLAGYGYCTLVSLLLCAFPAGNPYLFLFFIILRNSGLLIFDMLVWAMVSDCIDYQKKQTGVCSEGSVYSIYTLSRKIGSAVAGGLISFLLGSVGFVSGQAVQTAEAASSIRVMFVLCPMACTILGGLGIGIIYRGIEPVETI